MGIASLHAIIHVDRSRGAQVPFRYHSGWGATGILPPEHISLMFTGVHNTLTSSYQLSPGYGANLQINPCMLVAPKNPSQGPKHVLCQLTN